MKTLPEKAATWNMAGDKPVMLKKGEMGYYPLPGDFDVERFNLALGIDEEAIRVMTCASMFGWDIPAVTNYEEGK